jgi:hypothetical protein
MFSIYSATKLLRDKQETIRLHAKWNPPATQVVVRDEEDVDDFAFSSGDDAAVRRRRFADTLDNHYSANNDDDDDNDGEAMLADTPPLRRRRRNSRPLATFVARAQPLPPGGATVYQAGTRAESRGLSPYDDTRHAANYLRDTSGAAHQGRPAPYLRQRLRGRERYTTNVGNANTKADKVRSATVSCVFCSRLLFVFFVMMLLTHTPCVRPRVTLSWSTLCNCSHVPRP